MKTLAQALYDLSQRLPIDNVKVKQRLGRGYDILISNGYNVKKVGDDRFTIHRESTTLLEDNAVTYDVTPKGCSCPDEAPYGLCKHRLAVMLVLEMEKGE